MGDSQRVYFEPPENVKIRYPCIIYERDNDVTFHANNRPYMQAQRYQLTVIDRKPGSEFVQKVRQLPQCAFNRHFATSELNHDVFVIFD